ncbi:MAG: ABC transporter permease, partial [Gammaproteobacteria bacterium]
MFMLCGVFYPITTLPPSVQGFVQVLPLTHAVELVRPLIAGGPVHHAALHVAVLLAYALAGYYLAVILARRRLLL